MELNKEKITYFKTIELDEIGHICKYENRFLRIIKKSKTSYILKLPIRICTANPRDYWP